MTNTGTLPGSRLFRKAAPVLFRATVTPDDTVYARPPVTESMPSVVMSGLIPAQVMIAPLISPTIAPIPTTSTILMGAAMLSFENRTKTTPASGATPATDRSNPPEIRTYAWPIEMIPITAEAETIVTAFAPVSNVPLFMSENTTQRMITNTASSPTGLSAILKAPLGDHDLRRGAPVLLRGEFSAVKMRLPLLS